MKSRRKLWPRHGVQALPRASGQRGSIAVIFALTLLVAVVLVESLGLGLGYIVHRDVQKVADMAALSGAQNLRGLDCTAANAAAVSAAAANGETSDVVTNECGYWNPTDNFQLTGSTPDKNAVYVTVQRRFPYVPAWMRNRPITAQAVAIRNGTPIAVFSIASGLLTSQLGCVAACGAIANVNLNMLSFLKALGINVPSGLTVGGLYNLLSTSSVTYNQILNAVASLAGLNSISAVLTLPPLSVTGSTVPLLSTSASTRGLFNFDPQAPNSTALATTLLNANVNALQVVTAGVGIAIANGNHALSLSGSVTAPLGVDFSLSVISPPSIGIGGVGATAYSSQIRLYTHISSAALTGAVPLLGLVATVDLPIEIDVANALATVTSLCTATNSSGNDTATFTVQAPILQACIGNITPTSVLSNTTSCSTGLTSKTVLSLVGGLATINANISLAALPNTTGPYTLAAGQTAVTGPNQLQVGTTLTSLITQLFTALNTQLVGSLLGAPGSTSTTTGATATNLAKLLAPTAATTLGTASSAVSGALSSLTSLAGATNTTGVAASSASLLTAVSSATTSLLTSVNTLLNGLIGALIGPCGLIGGSTQSCLASTLNGNGAGTSTPNAVLAVAGTIANLLQPVLNALGAFVAQLLNATLGADLGTSNLTLIDLNCLGSGVRLVQ